MNVEDDIWWGRSKGKEESRSKEEVYIEGKMTLETKEVKKRGERMGMQVVGERGEGGRGTPIGHLYLCLTSSGFFLVNK